MNFKIGDKVRFLNEKGEGTVSKIINKTTVGITIEEGFELPCSVSELILSYDKTKTEIPSKNNKSGIVSSQIKSPKNQFPLEKGVRGINNTEKEGIYVA